MSYNEKNTPLMKRHPLGFSLVLILASLAVIGFSFGLGAFVSHASVTLNGSGVTASSTTGNFLELTSSTNTLFSVDNAGDVGANQFYGDTGSATPVPNLSFTIAGGLNVNAGGTNQNINLNPSGTGATVATNLEDKAGQVFNVKAYGAVGNGKANDQPAIMAAYDAAKVVDGTVYFPCGTYSVSSTLTISSPVNFLGEAQDCVTIKASQNPSFDVLDITGSNISLSQITLDGNATANSNYDVLGVGKGTNISNITLDHLTVIDGGNACMTDRNGGVSNLTVENSVMYGCGNGVIGFAATAFNSSNWNFTDNQIGSTTAPAFIGSGAYVSMYFGTQTASVTATNIRISNNSVLFPLLPNNQESDGIVLSTGGAASAYFSGVTINGNVVHGTAGTTPTNSHDLELWGVGKFAVNSNYFGNALTGGGAQQGASGTPCNGTYANNYFDIPLSVSIVQSLNPGCSVTTSGNYFNVGAWGIGISGSNEVVTANTIVLNQPDGGAIQDQCTESSTCTAQIISNNVLTAPAATTVSGAIYFEGKTGVSGMEVEHNTISNLSTGISLNGGPYTGLIGGTTFVNVSTHYYINPNVTTWPVLQETESTAPSGSCSNGSQYINTSGGASTTFYGCEAGSWVAK